MSAISITNNYTKQKSISPLSFFSFCSSFYYIYYSTLFPLFLFITLIPISLVSSQKNDCPCICQCKENYWSYNDCLDFFTKSSNKCPPREKYREALQKCALYIKKEDDPEIIIEKCISALNVSKSGLQTIITKVNNEHNINSNNNRNNTGDSFTARIAITVDNVPEVCAAYQEQIMKKIDGDCILQSIFNFAVNDIKKRIKEKEIKGSNKKENNICEKNNDNNINKNKSENKGNNSDNNETRKIYYYPHFSYATTNDNSFNLKTDYFDENYFDEENKKKIEELIEGKKNINNENDNIDEYKECVEYGISPESEDILICFKYE